MKARKVLLGFSSLIALLMILFPPAMRFHGEETYYGYYFILAIPDGYRLHGPLLLVQWFGLLLVTGLLLPVFGKDKNHPRGTVTRKGGDC
jgi:hypothetical protein